MGLAALVTVTVAALPQADLVAQENPMFFKPWRPSSTTAGKWPLVMKPGVRIRRNGPDVPWELIKDFGDSFVARTIPRNQTEGRAVYSIYWFSIGRGLSTVRYRGYRLEFSDCTVYPSEDKTYDDSTIETLWRDLQKPDRRCSFSENKPRFKQGGWGRAYYARDEPRE